jgi:hypothetical protein
LRKLPDVDVELINGQPGELTVLVNGQVVAKKGLLFMPSVSKVLAKVKEAEPASVG